MRALKFILAFTSVNNMEIIQSRKIQNVARNDTHQIRIAVSIISTFCSDPILSVLSFHNHNSIYFVALKYDILKYDLYLFVGSRILRIFYFLLQLKIENMHIYIDIILFNIQSCFHTFISYFGVETDIAQKSACIRL